MQVRGTDDLASLARSMNRMAAQLQQRIRELETLSTLQQRFVSDVSHELRTPMTTIKMAADVLYDSRDEMGPTESRSAELMSLEIDRFNTMLADLLDISRFNAGAAVLSLDEIDVSSLVKAEVGANAGMAQKLGVEIAVECASDDTTASVDWRGIRRLIRNLITNALEHAEGKPVQVTVAADDVAVAVTIRDHGIGFKAEDAARVFDRFWRPRPQPNPRRRRLRLGAGDLHGGRAAAQRLADGLGAPGPRRAVPADPAARPRARADRVTASRDSHRRRSRARRPLMRRCVALVVALALVSACASIPTSGPVEEVPLSAQPRGDRPRAGAARGGGHAQPPRRGFPAGDGRSG